MRDVILALEPCGCFIGIEPIPSEVTKLWRSWKKEPVQIVQVPSAEAEARRRNVFCSDEHRKAATP